MTACGRAEPPGKVAVKQGGAVGLVEGFGPGDSFDTFRARIGLGDRWMRERSGLAQGRRSLVYFLPEGNLHVDLKRNAAGSWELTATPLFLPADDSPDARIERWDKDRQAGQTAPPQLK